MWTLTIFLTAIFPSGFERVEAVRIDGLWRTDWFCMGPAAQTHKRLFEGENDKQPEGPFKITYKVNDWECRPTTVR